MNSVLQTDFTNVTEQPGQKATKEQWSIMVTRYDLAAKHAQNKDVLEVACGSGTGLDYIAKKAKSVVGGDIDPNLVAIAEKNYQNDPKVTVMQLDASNLPFAADSFDVVLLYEAIYYLPNAEQFIREAKRVLRKDGKLIIASVNCEWHGFNPSPFSTKYWSVQDFDQLFQKNQLKSTISLGFFDKPKGSSTIVSLIRKIAVQLRLIPTTMEGKEKLKRIFYGALKPIPAKIAENMAVIEPLIPYQSATNVALYKQIYIIGQF